MMIHPAHPVSRLHAKLLTWISILSFNTFLQAQPILDTVIFGHTPSEEIHSFESTLSEAITGSLSQPARRLRPKTPAEVNGGEMTVTMAVDPVRRNYFSLKLWGGDDTDDDIGRLYLYVPLNGVNYQVGYRHEGDYMPLSVAASKPPLPGRFFYSTTLLPLWMTQGKTTLALKIVSTGRLYGLGSGGPPAGNYQFNMTMDSRGIYRAYTHTEALLDPMDETQGAAPPVTIRPAVSEISVLGASGTYTNGLNGWVNNKLAADVATFTTTDVEMLAKSYITPQVTTGYNNPAVVSKIIEALDGFARDYYSNPSTSLTTSSYGGAGGNEVWGGRFGPLGWAIHLMESLLVPSLDVAVSYGTAGGIRVRRAAWADMLAASRDSGRFNRRTITNQTLIGDGNIYKANRGLLVLGDTRAFTETGAQRYLREACGLVPWLGSDLPGGGSSLKYGSSYLQVTPKGLTREWGYVGGYGEMQTYAATFYEWTGNPEFRDQAVKMIKARAPFRRPAIEVSGANFYQTMERTGLIAWRGVRETDGDFSNEINYGDAVSWSAGARVAGRTQDFHAIGYAKQMLADNQFYNNLVADTRFYSGLGFDARMAFEVWADNIALKNAPDSGIRLPMSDGQPDFVWSDEEGGVIAIKKGSERLWIAPYWQAKTGTGINGIARFHRSTAAFDQYGVLETTPRFKAGGYFIRPEMIDKPESTGYTPPDVPSNAYAGEMLPLGKVPGDAQDEAPFRGKTDAYAFRLGRYLIGMNASFSPFGLKVPIGFTSATDLVTGSVLTAISGEVSVPASSTVVLYLNDPSDAAPVPNAPLCLVASGNSTPSVNLSWTAASGAVTYTVKRSTISGGPYTAIEEATDIAETGFTDTAVSDEAAYFYVVTAFNANGESYPSMEASVSAGLPPPWFATDVGSVAISGSSSYLDQKFTLQGTGMDVGGMADSFHFASLPVNGDGTITARLSSRLLGGTSDDKVGLMVRDGIAAGAVNFSLFVDALVRSGEANRARVSYRSSSNASTTFGGEGPAVGIPEWLKVVRSGNSFSGYFSDDGSTWTLVASTTISNMPASARFGLFVCSRDAVAVNTSVFEGVTAPGWSVPPPAPLGLSATAGDESAGLAWSTSPGASGYNLKRSTASGGPYLTVATGVTSNHFTDSGLANLTEYHYVVSATNSAGESSDSEETSVTPLPQPPDAPTGLTASAGNEFVSLAWNASFGAASYKVKRAMVSGSPFTEVASGVVSTDWTDNSVTNGITYHYAVTAVSVKGESAPSMQVSATPSAVPQPPSTLTAMAMNSAASLFWQASSGAAAYTLKRSATSGGPYAVVASGISGTSYQDGGMANGTPWFYVVTASNATGESANSPEASGLPSTTVMPTPWSRMDIGAVGVAGGSAWNAGTFTALASGTDIWNAEDQFHFVYQPTAGNCTIIARVTSLQNMNLWAKAGVMIRQSLDANAKNVFLGVTPTTTNGIRYQNRTSAGGSTVTSHSRTGSSSSIPRWLRIVRSGDIFTASRSSNGSNWTTMGSVTVSMTGTVYIGLATTSHDNLLTTSAIYTNVSLTLSTVAAPGGLAANTSNSLTNLSWNATAGASSYNLKRSSSSGGPYTIIASGLTATTHTDTTAAAGNTYYYVVSAVNAKGESANSAETGAMPVVSVPPALAGLTATPGNVQVALSWPTVSGAAYYKVKRSSQAGGPYALIATPTSAVLTDMSVSNGATYFYVVSVVNSAGEGADSVEASATPQLPVPDMPVNPIAASGDTKIILSWSAAANAAGYKVKRSTVSGGPYVLIASPALNQFTDTDLTNGTPYHYVVSAVNGSGESADSAQATGTPLSNANGIWANPSATAKPGVTTTAGDPNLTLSANPFAVGDLVQAAVAFPGFTSGRFYWVVSSIGATIQLSASKGGAAITPTASATTASALRSSQLWNTATNWTGSVVARGADVTATFPAGSPASDVATVLVDADTTIGRLLYSNNSSVADFTLATGPDHTLGFAVSGSIPPMIEVPVASNRRLNLGERDHALLRISGNQGLLIRSSAGGSVTSGIGSNPNKEVTIFNTDWSAFSGGITVDRGILSVQAANKLPQQSLTLGTGFSTTANVLAGLSMTAAQTIDGLHGNAQGRVSGSQNLTIGVAHTGGNFGGVFGQQFNGIRDATSLIKNGSARQEMSGLMTGNGTASINDGTLVFSGASAHNFSGTVTVNSSGSLFVNGTLAPVPPIVSITLAGSSGSANFTSSFALKNGDQVRVTTANAGLTLATVYQIVNTPAASTVVQVSTAPGGAAFTATATATATTQFLNSTIGTSGRVIINSGATLGGIGTFSPFDTAGGTTTAVSIAGSLSPGDPLTNGGIGTLTLNGSNTTRTLCTFENGGSLSFQISPASSDLLSLTAAQAGDVVFNGNVIHFLDASSGTLPTGDITLLTSDVANAFIGIASDANGIITSGLSIGTGLESYASKALKRVGDSIALSLVNPPPAAPATLAATAGVEQVALSWNASAGARTYIVRRSNTSGGPYQTVGSGITSTGFTDASVSYGITYHYIVVALNEAGESGASPETSATLVPTSASITLGNLSQPHDSFPKPVRVTTTPGGLAVLVTYDGSTIPPSLPGSYEVAASLVDPAYMGSAVGTLVIREPISTAELSSLRIADWFPARIELLVTLPGHTYQLQRSSTMIDGSWFDVGDSINGAGIPLIFKDPANTGLDRQFYRVRIQP